MKRELKADHFCSSDLWLSESHEERIESFTGATSHWFGAVYESHEERIERGSAYPNASATISYESHEERIERKARLWSMRSRKLHQFQNLMKRELKGIVLEFHSNVLICVGIS
jgi:hypothetical protein